MIKKLVLTTNINQIAYLPPFVEDIKAELSPLSGEQSFNLNLALEEAVTNVINYAYPDGQEHYFSLDAEIQEGLLVLTLIDDGEPFDPTAVPPADVNAPVEERQIGGLGIFLITKLMHEVKYERRNDQNVFTMTMKI